MMNFFKKEGTSKVKKGRIALYVVLCAASFAVGTLGRQMASYPCVSEDSAVTDSAAEEKSDVKREGISDKAADTPKEDAEDTWHPGTTEEKEVPSTDMEEVPTESESNSNLININTADSAELMTLYGVGEKISQRIIDYRETNGPFEVIEDIMKVSGIGEKRFANIKDKICVE